MTMAHPLSINRTAPVLQVNGAPLAASALAALMELQQELASRKVSP